MKQYTVYLTEIEGRDKFIEGGNDWGILFDHYKRIVTVEAENEEEAAKLAEAKANLAPYEDYLADIDNDEGLDIDDYLVPFYIEEME